MVHVDGRVIGEHRGLPYYTVGQRHGLGVAAGERLYVVSLDAVENKVIVGPEESLYATALDAEEVSFVTGMPPVEKAEVTVKVRSHAPEVPATLFPYEGRRALLRFAEPQRAITPGQAVVFYDRDEVLGGGLIASAERECRALSLIDRVTYPAL
jgi:tRNA-specific 2-thiouridylase